MIRPSSLTLARDCQLAPVLSERFPTSSAATARGNDVDDQASGELRGGQVATDPDARAWVDWVRRHFPHDELRVQERVELYDPDTGGLITAGTPDVVAWNAESGHLTVIDGKKREQWWAGRLAPPDRNLQLHAYALAEAARLGAFSYELVLLLFGDGEAEPIRSEFYLPETWAPVLEEIREIAVSQPDEPRGNAGPHCMACWSRVHCHHWVLPAHEGPSELEPLTKPGGLTLENFARALAAKKALEEVAERVGEQLKAFADQHGGAVPLGNGKRWGRVMMPGKAGVDKAALERDGLLDRYSTKGAPFEQWRVVGRAK